MNEQEALVEPGPPLTPEERGRYQRQLVLPEIGELGQRRLGNARVLVVGAGGLGSPVLTALAGAGVGTLGIIDNDTVEISNLHRQAIHAGAAPGSAKVDSAVRALRELNPLVTVMPFHERFTADAGRELIARFDLVVDCADTFATHSDVIGAAEEHGVPVVWGSSLGMDGQVTVFDRGRGGVGSVGLDDLYPVLPADQPGGACQAAGILGPVCGAVGSVMAIEAIKLIVGTGRPLRGRMLVVDGWDQTWREIEIRPR